ncbi:MAG: cytochrome c3 family protein [Armatimonas sp.]
MGRLHSREDARRCVRCHAVTLPEHSNIPERKFFGVGCESCHGPGSAHVAASQSANYDRDRPENLAKLTGVQMNQKCGVCHGQVEEVATKPASLQLTNRMQPYGLSKSACFQKSNGKLTCITCHNPHENAEHNPQFYVKVCLTCHKAPQGKACPVQPATDCVRCHMPTFPAIPDSALPTKMADHWIRVQKNLK